MDVYIDQIIFSNKNKDIISMAQNRNIWVHDSSEIKWKRSRIKKKLHGLSPRANYTDRPSDRRLSAK
jgi:hypothetical protein